MKTAETGQRRSWVAIIVVTLLCILWLLPTVGLLVTSFRPIDDINSSGWWEAIFKPAFTLQNYVGVFDKSDMGMAFINALAVAVPATIIPIMFAAFAAYAFTFLEFKGKDFLFITIVAVMVVPLQVALQPMLDLLGPRGLGIAGQYVAVWMLHTGFGMPLAIYTLRNYMTTLPKSIIESAKMDGATHYQTFWRLVFPMSTPAIAGFAILQFLWVWNDLLIALLFLKPDNQTVIVSLKGMLGTQGQGWELLTASGFISMALPVFIALQRYFVRGMTAGAVKG